MVCFVRKDLLEILHNDPATVSLEQMDPEVVFPVEKFNYELLFSKPFPFHVDARSTDEKILDAVKYFINRHLYTDDPFFDEEKNIFEFPVESIFHFVHDVADTNELRTIIRKEFVINENDCVVHNLPESSDSELEYSDDETQFEDRQNNYQNPDNDGDWDWKVTLNSMFFV